MNTVGMSRREPPADLPEIRGYQVLEQIGFGGFSRVFRATQLSFDRPVAIKVLNSSSASEAQRSMFDSECRVVGRLPSDPHIVTVYESAITAQGDPCIVMELYEGTYRDVGRLTIADVVDIGAKVSNALAQIHSNRIIHRDIKPHNLFRSSGGEPAIADFGIASMLDDRSPATRYTLKYAPPELLRDSEWGTASDIYSLGATLYQLIEGRVPFDGADDAEIVGNIMVAAPPKLDRADAPPELDRLLQRCLAKRPSDRPADASMIANEFARIREVVGLPSRLKTSNAPDTASTNSPFGGPTTNARLGTSEDSHTHTGDRRDIDDAIERPRYQPVDTAASPPPIETTKRPRRRIAAITVLVAAIIVAGAAAIIASSGGNDETPSSTTVARAATPPPIFEVIRPPSKLSVRQVSGGYEFTWVSSDVGDKIQIHRVNTDQNIITDESPFTWLLGTADGVECFVGRAVNADGTRMSQTTTDPVCATTDNG